MIKFKYIRRTVLACLLALILAIRFVPYGGEFYATYLYPTLSFGLSLLSSFIPWSLEEILVCAFIAGLVLYPIIALCCRQKHILLGELETILWIVCWFYLGWGCNYFRTSFYERLMIAPVTYSEAAFTQFLQAYTDSLNRSYTTDTTLDRAEIRNEIKALFRKVPAGYGLTKPRAFQEPKKLLFNELYSKVGVLGYMGPFMAESQVNEALKDLEYPFTYAHELSHLLGISNEAEANFWAFQICTESTEPLIRYSGYNGILGYMGNNAKSALSEAEYDHWIKTLKPEVLADEKRLRAYWKSQRNHTLDTLQETFYNLYLKSNNIPEGMQNYNQVIGMLMALKASQEEPLRRQGRALSVKQ